MCHLSFARNSNNHERLQSCKLKLYVFTTKWRHYIISESDDNLSFGDFNASDESQAHEEDEPDNDIDQALFDLKVEVGWDNSVILRVHSFIGQL